jgi:hypothetical protein
MRGTKLDVIVGTAVLLFILFLIAMLVGPVRTLANERDELRTEHVRSLMTKILQLQLIDPEAYDRLVTDVAAQGELRSVIGYGNCSGSSGRQCPAEVTAESCLSLGEYFPPLLLSSVPVDPWPARYSPEATGYYLAIVGAQLEVGACGAFGEAITLQKDL